jgi:enoyl-CoA hydratase
MALVELERNGGVRTITLNAPERLNALDHELLRELRSAIAEVAADPEAAALVVTGQGRAFCAGADLDDLFGDTGRPVAALHEDLLEIYGCFLGIRDLTIPTIAAVHGAAVGAGLNIALVCDIIISGPKAVFGPTFAAIGLHPGGGCSWMLTERLGRSRANAVLLSGKTLRTDQAFALGLGDILADDAKGEAQELAASFAARDADLNSAIKSTVMLASTSTFAEALEAESWRQAKSLQGDAFAAFRQDFRKR